MLSLRNKDYKNRTEKQQIMKYISFTLLILILATELALSKEKEPQVKLEVSIYPEEGWMNGGYGRLIFKYSNESGGEIKTGEVTGEWNVGNEKYNKWNWTPNLTLAKNEEKEGKKIGWMPPKTEKLAGSSVPVIKGNAVVFVRGKKLNLPYKIEVPVAKLLTPLVSYKGKYIEVVLQEKTWANVNDPQKIATYIDDAYAAMFELTGRRPYNGDRVALKECPRNPYFAYAGNPIVLNGAHVLNSVKSFDNDRVDFGWIHEMGHDFDDVIGQYYNYGTFTEFQANIKLSYAIEQLCTEESVLKIKSWVDKKSLLMGTSFNNEYFAPKADKYLADTTRSWETLSSDEYHAMFHRVIRQHGWEVMKKYYRVFGSLSKSGIVAPKGRERIYLSLAVLDKCCKQDLVPIFTKWRIPADHKKMKLISEKYKLETL